MMSLLTKKSITDPGKKVKILKYFGFAAVFKADVLRGDSDRGYIGAVIRCRLYSEDRGRLKVDFQTASMQE